MPSSLPVLWCVVAAAASASPAAPPSDLDLDKLPSPLPSGMDLLYGDRVAFRDNGEPIVTLGLMTEQKKVRIESDGGMLVDYYEQGTFKRTHVGKKKQVLVTIRRAQPAARSHYVDVEGVDWNENALVDWAVSGWRARGYPQAKALEEGSVLGIGGRVVDNRAYRVVIPVANGREAQALAAEIYERFGSRAVPRNRLAERPWAELELHVVDPGRSERPGTRLGLATSFVRFAPVDGAPLTVREIEHSKGYDWHGFADRRYRGEIYATVDPDGLLAAVNVLGVEELLEGVVPSEIFASAPSEALKAQAIAARNTLLAKLGTRHHGDPFRLCAEQHCQVYTGLEREDPRTSDAVHATTGETLFHQHRLVDAVYSSSCGGHTEDNDVVWGDKQNAALRGRPDFDVEAHPELASFAGQLDGAEAKTWLTMIPETYCQKATSSRADKFRWERSFESADLQKVLKGYAQLGRLRDVAIGGRGRGGKVLSLTFTFERGVQHVLHELPIRRLFSNLNSGAFVVDLGRDTEGFVSRLTFRGGGWGHGVGMCQLGAIGRAEAGHDYGRILGHYYNGAGVETLYRPLRAAR